MAEEDALLAARVQRARQAFDDPGNDDVLMVGPPAVTAPVPRRPPTEPPAIRFGQ